jgi:endo-1,4-beta-xylanase
LPGPFVCNDHMVKRWPWVHILSFLLVMPHVLVAATLEHHWRFEEGSGSVVSDSAGSADLTITGVTTGWSAGREGGAYFFDGTNYAQSTLKDVVTDPGSEVAVAGWFRTSSTSTAVIFQIETLYELRLRKGQLQVSFRGNARFAPRWGEEVNDGVWHHFVAQNRAGTTELYLDGVLIGSRAENLLSLNTESKKTTLAAQHNAGRRFAGGLDEVRYYSGSLTLQEIRALAGVANVPPTAQDDAYTVALDTTLSVTAPGVLANDADVDGDAMTAVLQSGPATGSLTLNPDGSLTFIPPSGFTGEVYFTYLARDKDGDSEPATVTLTVLDPTTSLTPDEVAQIEGDLGIILSAQEKLDLAAIVKPVSTDPWRSEANLRIENERKANLTVEVVDALGNPVPGAAVRAVLRRHDFKFGGVVRVMDQTDAAGNLSAAGSTVADWDRLTRALFNAVGLDNGFKPKITSQHTYLPGFMDWAAAAGLPVRGHLLIWPGGGDLEDLDNPDGVPGVDYGDHLSTASTSAYASHNVLGAVDAYKAGSRTQSDREALAAVVEAEIREWAGRWDVYQWDVINESIGNTLLQEILGFDSMVDWFRMAAEERVHPGAGLFINDFQIFSAKFETGNTSYQTRRDTYFSRIDSLLAAAAPVDGIGFQSRFKFFRDYGPETLYARMEEFAARYPDLDFAGTEFEIPDWYDYYSGELVQAYDEASRARWTEEIMTLYFSHPPMTGLVAWDFINPLPDGTASAYSRALCYYGDGPGGQAGPLVKLNGLVWFYLHRIRYHTDATAEAGTDGRALVRGFKGDYDIEVSYEGSDYPAVATLSGDATLRVVLDDVELDGYRDAVVIAHWAFDDGEGTALQDAANSAGGAGIAGPTPGVATDGTGALRIAQNAALTSGGSYPGGTALDFGGRSTGRYEMLWTIGSARLDSGDANGATAGFGLRDGEAGTDLFRIRLNKTTGGLAISTYVDSTYTTVRSFGGQYQLAGPVVVRSVIDLDLGAAEVFVKVGDEAKTGPVHVALSSVAATWDQMSFTAVNNSTDWGNTDEVLIDDLVLRKVGLDHFGRWRERTDWQGFLETGEDDDPDGDGLVNLYEYALGGNPVVADNPGTRRPTLRWNGGQPVIEFTPARDGLDTRYYLEHSLDLVDWTGIPSTPVQGEGGVLQQLPLPSGEEPRWFTRLRVESW